MRGMSKQSQWQFQAGCCVIHCCCSQNAAKHFCGGISVKGCSLFKGARWSTQATSAQTAWHGAL